MAEVFAVNRLGFSNDPIVDFQYMRTLASMSYGGASIGEVLYANSDYESRGGGRDAFIRSFEELGYKVAAQADAGSRRSACSSHLRAYNYLRAAEFFFPASRPIERRTLYRSSVLQFDAAAERMRHPVEKIAIPYAGGVSMPGYLFSVADDGRPRPTVIVCGGGDGAGEELYLLAGVPEALARGLNALVFHGPGHRGLQLEHPSLGFRPDAEVPIGAVIDFAMSRPEIDAERLALYGMSFGGYLAPRAAAHCRQIKALVANAPIVSFLGFAKSMADSPARADDQVASLSWSSQAMVENYTLWHHGVASLEQFLSHIEAFNLHGLVEEISCPTLSVTAEAETEEAKAQSRAFNERLRAPKYVIELTAAESGADNHCGISNLSRTSSLIYDWITDRLK